MHKNKDMRKYLYTYKLHIWFITCYDKWAYVPGVGLNWFLLDDEQRV